MDTKKEAAKAKRITKAVKPISLKAKLKKEIEALKQKKFLACEEIRRLNEKIESQKKNELHSRKRSMDESLPSGGKIETSCKVIDVLDTAVVERLNCSAENDVTFMKSVAAMSQSPCSDKFVQPTFPCSIEEQVAMEKRRKEQREVLRKQAAALLQRERDASSKNNSAADSLETKDDTQNASVTERDKKKSHKQKIISKHNTEIRTTYQRLPRSYIAPPLPPALLKERTRIAALEKRRKEQREVLRKQAAELMKKKETESIVGARDSEKETNDECILAGSKKPPSKKLDIEGSLIINVDSEKFLLHKEQTIEQINNLKQSTMTATGKASSEYISNDDLTSHSQSESNKSDVLFETKISSATLSLCDKKCLEEEEHKGPLIKKDVIPRTEDDQGNDKGEIGFVSGDNKLDVHNSPASPAIEQAMPSTTPASLKKSSERDILKEKCRLYDNADRTILTLRTTQYGSTKLYTSSAYNLAKWTLHESPSLSSLGTPTSERTSMSTVAAPSERAFLSDVCDVDVAMIGKEDFENSSIAAAAVSENSVVSSYRSAQSNELLTNHGAVEGSAATLIRKDGHTDPESCNTTVEKCATDIKNCALTPTKHIADNKFLQNRDNGNDQEATAYPTNTEIAIGENVQASSTYAPQCLACEQDGLTSKGLYQNLHFCNNSFRSHQLHPSRPISTYHYHLAPFSNYPLYSGAFCYTPTFYPMQYAEPVTPYSPDGLHSTAPYVNKDTSVLPHPPPTGLSSGAFVQQPVPTVAGANWSLPPFSEKATSMTTCSLEEQKKHGSKSVENCKEMTGLPRSESIHILSTNCLDPPSPFAITHAMLAKPIILVKRPKESFGVSVTLTVESALIPLLPKSSTDTDLGIDPLTLVCAIKSNQQTITIDSTVENEVAEGENCGEVDRHKVSQSMAESDNQIAHGNGDARKPKRRRRRRRAFFAAMTVIDATVQNSKTRVSENVNADSAKEEECDTQGTDELHAGDILIAINGRSTLGLTFAGACELFKSSTTIGTDGMIRCPVEVARAIVRTKPSAQKLPFREKKDLNASCIARLPLKQADFVILFTSILKSLLDQHHRFIGFALTDDEIQQQIALIDFGLSKISFSHLKNKWKLFEIELQRTMQAKAAEHWERSSLSYTQQFGNLLEMIPITESKLASLRAAPRPTNGSCKCGSKDHRYVHDAECFLYWKFQKQDDSGNVESFNGKDKKKSDYQRKVLNLVEKAYTDRFIKLKQEQVAIEAEAIFVDKMEILQISKYSQAVFAPSLEAIVLSAVVEVGLKYKSLKFCANRNLSYSENNVSDNNTMLNTAVSDRLIEDEKCANATDDEDDDVPLALLGDKGATMKPVSTSNVSDIESLLRHHFLAILVSHISKKWGHIYREPSDLEYSWRWEIFHGQYTSSRSRCIAGSKNPRKVNSCSLESVQFLLDDDTVSVFERVDCNDEYNEAVKALTFILEPSQTGICDELLSLLQTNVLRIDEERGIPVLACDWYNKVDALLLNDMNVCWGRVADPYGKYGIIEEVRELCEHWERTANGWLLKNEDDIIYSFDELQEWRDAFENKHQLQSEGMDGVGKFY